MMLKRWQRVLFMAAVLGAGTSGCASIMFERSQSQYERGFRDQQQPYNRR